MNKDAPAPSADHAPAGKRPPVKAMDILGLKRAQAVISPAVSVELEVDNYLSTLYGGTGILEFWQVVQFLILIYQPANICI